MRVLEGITKNINYLFIFFNSFYSFYRFYRFYSSNSLYFYFILLNTGNSFMHSSVIKLLELNYHIL